MGKCVCDSQDRILFNTIMLASILNFISGNISKYCTYSVVNGMHLFEFIVKIFYQVFF